jgi:hypothetical protein
MERHPGAVGTIHDWGKSEGYDAVIWTSLASNFHEPDKVGEPFSLNGALRHLENLDNLSFARALHYIWNAPPEIQTPLRDAVSERWPLRDN